MFKWGRSISVTITYARIFTSGNFLHPWRRGEDQINGKAADLANASAFGGTSLCPTPSILLFKMLG